MSAAPALTLAQVNALGLEGFVAAFGSVYEHSPWVAREAWRSHPFPSVMALHAAMQESVLVAPEASQLALIRAHPELLGKLEAAELTAESRGEQASAGLHRCTLDEREQMQALNGDYRDKFGFPFVVAVRGLNWAGIIARIVARLPHERERELHVALSEIGRIARLRIDDLVRD